MSYPVLEGPCLFRHIDARHECSLRSINAQSSTRVLFCTILSPFYGRERNSKWDEWDDKQTTGSLSAVSVVGPGAMFSFWTKAQKQQQMSVPASTDPLPSSSSPPASSCAAAEGTGSAPATDLAVAISTDLAEARPSTPSTVSASTDKVNDQSDIAAPRPSTDPDIAEIQKVPRASLQADTASTSNQNTSDPPRRTRRLSFQSFSFGQSKRHPAEHISHAKQVKKEEAAGEALKERKLGLTREGRKIDRAAAALATIILGPVYMVASTAASVTTSSKKPIQPPKPKPAGPQTMQKVQNQLLTPKQANKVIAKLRTIDPAEESPNLPPHKYPQLQHMDTNRGERPIHAVCLDCTDEEADECHFSKLATTTEVELRNSRKRPTPARSYETSFASADITTIVPVLRSMKLVTLVTAPDLGFGQPPDSPGLLAGSVPSARAFSEGLQEMTGQLMALGFATSKVVFPNHTGVYPPTDRMSILTCTSTPSAFALSLTLW